MEEEDGLFYKLSPLNPMATLDPCIPAWLHLVNDRVNDFVQFHFCGYAPYSAIVSICSHW